MVRLARFFSPLAICYDRLDPVPLLDMSSLVFWELEHLGITVSLGPKVSTCLEFIAWFVQIAVMLADRHVMSCRLPNGTSHYFTRSHHLPYMLTKEWSWSWRYIINHLIPLSYFIMVTWINIVYQWKCFNKYPRNGHYCMLCVAEGVCLGAVEGDYSLVLYRVSTISPTFAWDFSEHDHVSIAYYQSVTGPPKYTKPLAMYLFGLST